MALVGSLVVSMSAQTDQFQRGMQQAQISLRVVQSSVKDTQSTLNGFESALTNLALRVVSIQAIERALTSLVQAGARLELIRITMGNVFGSMQAGAEALARTNALAQTLGVNAETLAESFTAVTAAARGTVLEGASVEKLFTQVVSAMRALGKSSTDTQGVLLALQQILTKGTITAEDFRGQIAERLPGALGILARALGVPIDQITKMMERGELGARSLARFGNQLQSELGNKATAAAQSFDAAMERMKNAWTQMGDTLMQSRFGTYLKEIVELLERAAQGAERALRGRTTTFPAIEQITQGLPELRKSPEAKAIETTLDDISKAQAKAAELEAQIAKLGSGDTAGKAWRTERLQQFNTEVDRLNKLLNEQMEKLKALADVQLGEGARKRIEEMRGSEAAKQAQNVIDNYATLREKLDEFSTLWRDTQQKIAAAPENTDAILQKFRTDSQKLVETIDSLRAKLAADIPALNTLTSSLFQNLTDTARKNLETALPLIQRIGKETGISANLMTAIAYRESRFDPRAVSSAGAQGIMQIMPDVGKRLGLKDPFNMEENIRAAAKLLQELITRFQGDTEKVVQAYHGGLDPKNYGPKNRQYVQDIMSDLKTLGTDMARTSSDELTRVGDKTKAIMDDLKTKQLDLASVDIFARSLASLQTEYFRRVLDPDAFAAAQLALQRMAQENEAAFKRAFALDPAQFKKDAQEIMQTWLELRNQAEVSLDLGKLAQQQRGAIDDVIRSLQDEARQLTMTKAEIEDYTLASANATEADYERAKALRDRAQLGRQIQDALQRSEEEGNAGAAIVAQQGDQLRAFQLTRMELLDYQLTLAQAGEETRKLAFDNEALLQSFEMAGRAADWLSSTFEDLLFNSKTTFKDIAIGFARMVFSMLMDDANFRKKLNGMLFKRIT